MTKRILAIIFIFACASVAWAILGATIFSRTYSSDSVAEDKVVSLWGAPQTQRPPTASFKRLVPKTEESIENGKKIVKTVQHEEIVDLPLESSAIDVALDLEHRQKGLLWYSTYKVGFSGFYRFRNISDKEETVVFELKFPVAQAIYDDLNFVVNDVTLPISNQQN
jgi:hypothetical protein